LFVTTTNSTIFIPTKPQTLQGDGTTIYTGTAGVLAAPAKKLVSVDGGYAGVEDKFGIMTCEFGTVLVDTLRGTVFLLNEGLEEISNNGLRNWFKDLGKFSLQRYVPITISDYYTNVNGCGLLTTYDPRHRRLILH